MALMLVFMAFVQRGFFYARRNQARLNFCEHEKSVATLVGLLSRNSEL